MNRGISFDGPGLFSTSSFLNQYKQLFACTLICLAWAGCASTPTPPATQPAPANPIQAALPVIPDVNFNLIDFGGVGDYKTFNTDAFTKAVAAIAKAGGGHLIVPPGVYKTLPFSLTSHMDLHLDAGATIRAPDTYADYGIPDPNLPRSASAPSDRFGGPRLRPLISCPQYSTDISITGTIDGSGAMFGIWSDKAARHYPPGRRIIFRPNLIVLQSVQRLLVDGVTL